jgi:hypothetical protein
MAKRKKKLSLKKAAECLTAIAETHLSKLPEEEQDARVATFSKTEFISPSDTDTKPSWSSQTQPSRAVARGRE